MKLACVSIVRDECDIIESFVRHNAVFFDRLYILDNASTDSTPAILRRLSEEGFPLVVVPDEEGYYYQARLTLKLLKLALDEERWDYLFPLDSDEFIDVPSRHVLEAALAPLAEDMLGFSNYIQYIPKEDDNNGEPDVLRRIVHRAEVTPKLVGKVVLPGRLIAHPEFSTAEGNHKATLSGARIPGRRIDQLDLAHYPVRSIDQFVSSTIVSRLAWLSRADYKPAWSQHIQAFYENLKTDPEPEFATLTRAMDHYIEPYSENGPPERVTISRSPLKPAYDRLRYEDLIDVKTLPRVMGMAEGLVAKLHQLRAPESRAFGSLGKDPVSRTAEGSTSNDTSLENSDVLGDWKNVSGWRPSHLRIAPEADSSPALERGCVCLIEDEQDSWRNIQIEVMPQLGLPTKIVAEIRFDSVDRQVVVMMAAGLDRFAGKLDPASKRTSNLARGDAVVSKCIATPLRDNWWRIELIGFLAARSSDPQAFIIIALTKNGFREDYLGDGTSGISVGRVIAMQGLANSQGDLKFEQNPWSKVSDTEIASWYQEKTFSSDWTTVHFPVWQRLLNPWRELDAKVIELGSWEGRSALFFLNFLPRARLVCVDPFVGGEEHRDQQEVINNPLPEIERRFDANVAAFAGRIEKIKLPSNVAVPTLAIGGRQFDVAYVDGSHRAADVYSDAALTWPLLVTGGIMIFDDYEWKVMGDPVREPRLGIDTFLRTFEGRYRIIHHGYQVAVEKIR